MKLGGYPQVTGQRGQLFFSTAEEKAAKFIRKRYVDKFLIMWTLKGAASTKSTLCSRRCWGGGHCSPRCLHPADWWSYGDERLGFEDTTSANHPVGGFPSGRSSPSLSMLIWWAVQKPPSSMPPLVGLPPRSPYSHTAATTTSASIGRMIFASPQKTSLATPAISSTIPLKAAPLLR